MGVRNRRSSSAWAGREACSPTSPTIRSERRRRTWRSTSNRRGRLVLVHSGRPTELLAGRQQYAGNRRDQTRIATQLTRSGYNTMTNDDTRDDGELTDGQKTSETATESTDPDGADGPTDAEVTAEAAGVLTSIDRRDYMKAVGAAAAASAIGGQRPRPRRPRPPTPRSASTTGSRSTEPVSSRSRSRIPTGRPSRTPT